MVGADSLRSDFGGCQSLLRCLLGGGGGVYVLLGQDLVFTLAELKAWLLVQQERPSSVSDH